MASEDDRFFQQRLANLRQSQELLESTRNRLKQQAADAGGYFGRLCLQLKDDQQLVKSLQDMSSKLLLRIATGMDISQGSEIRDRDHRTLHEQSVVNESLALASTPLAKSNSSMPSRPVGRSDFMRGIGKPSATISSLFSAPPEPEKNKDDEQLRNDPTPSSPRSSSESDPEELDASEFLPDETPRDRSNEVEDEADHQQQQPELPAADSELVALGRFTAMEKLSILCTLINTLNFWDEELLLDGSYSSTNWSSVYTIIAAARESQKRLFKMLNSSDQSKPGLCCAAIRELVRAYPPERLLPAGFLRILLKNTDTTEKLEAYQDGEAANFWEMLMNFAVSLMDEHGNTADQVGLMLLHSLVPALAPEQQPVAEDLEEARGVLRLFLVSQICCRIMYKDRRSSSSSGGGGGGWKNCDGRSSVQSRGDGSDSDRKLEKSRKSKRIKSKALWKYVLGVAWKKNTTKRWH